MTVIDKGLMGSAVPTRQVESFNLDAVINGEHVLVARRSQGLRVACRRQL